ncbi:DUF4304 domain-containing protein [Flavobacterium sp.]|uniref:DUF4304 domain-containing protein n=1 Tax=Flavobacterium sp. TaxID=239 RepID=UPI0025BABE71|nr:DUF4304 domain-containing protein [Flavobacterium sp.]
MENKEFKKTFGEIAKKYKFSNAFGGWFKANEECLAILELQKSSFGNNYYLNIKIFIQGAFSRVYTPNKDLIKSPIGHITNQIRDNKIFDFDNLLESDKRKIELEEFFKDVIIPFVDKTMSISGVKELEAKGKITLLPAIKIELDKVGNLPN